MPDRFLSILNRLPGNMETCDGPDWGVLPEEMKELIVSKLPLVDLARASATSKIFQAVFRRELAREQQACCECGVERLGRERIITLIALIDRVLKGEDMNVYVDQWWDLDPAYCILRDGTCHNVTQPVDVNIHITHAGNSMVRFGVREESGPHGMSMQVQVQIGLCGFLVIFVRAKEVGSLVKFSTIALYGVEGVPVVQALLSEGLARMFHDAGHQVEVRIRGRRKSKLTWAGLRAVVAPVMPFIMPRRFRLGELVGVLK